MRAMIFRGGSSLEPADLPIPEPGPGQVRLRVLACGICRTDLHILDGDLSDPKRPVVPGHQIVGVIDATGVGVDRGIGEQVGVPWLGWTCGACGFCDTHQENLCDRAEFTGYHRDGGLAEYCIADERYCFAVDGDPVQVAPLLCAGLIGYRALRLAGDPRRIGIYGFGSAAHILCQLATWQGREVYAFTRPGDSAGQDFARDLGARWAGGSDERPPKELDAALIFAPVGPLVPAALRVIRKGGVVVCGGIHMSDIPAFPYADLWGERQIRSVANLTRRDGDEFLALAPRVPIRTRVHRYPLEAANEALSDLRRGRFEGSAVVIP